MTEQRPPKRSYQQALAIARRLRELFISPEAEQAARSAMAGLLRKAAANQPEAQDPAPASRPAAADGRPFYGRAADGSTLEAVRQREGIVLPKGKPEDENRPFTEDERRKAKAILELFKSRYGVDLSDGKDRLH